MTGTLPNFRFGEENWENQTFSRSCRGIRIRAHVARMHWPGRRGFTDTRHAARPRSIRRLLGINAEDRELILAEVSKMLVH
jgi:hypothetical protein